MMVLVVAIVILLASFVGGFIGFGAGTITLPLLIFFFPPQNALFLVAVVHLSLNIWAMIFFRRGLVWPLIIAFGIPALIGSLIGSLLVVQIDDSLLARLIGIFLIVYVIFSLYRPTFCIPRNRFFALLGGSVSGFSGGLIGSQGPLRAAFLRGYNLPKETYLACGAAIGFLVDVARIISYWSHDIKLPVPLWHIALFLIPATFIGVYSARLLVMRIDRERFMQWVAIALLLVGLKLALGF